MLLSYIVKKLKQYSYRWIFGLALYILIFGIGIMTTSLQQHQSSLPFTGVNGVYTATLTDLPKEKDNTIALTIKIDELDKKILAYITKDSSAMSLSAGDQISFFSEIKPFERNYNRYDFDYARYMYNQGYAGQTFIAHDRWEKVTTEKTSLLTIPVKCRQSILGFYRSMNLSLDEIALLSALTLGYKNDLNEDIIESFRTTGTAHILAISGLHMGFIYLILMGLSYFLTFHKHLSRLRIYLVVVLLWGYVLTIGLPASAVRATIMLSILTLGGIYRLKGNVYNSIFVAAFFILLFSPFSIFDIGFQLSFIAVLSICILQPIFSNLICVQNRILQYAWNLFCISIVVQIGVAPLCIYYFGVFPTYFFITNLLAIPLITLIIYCGIGVAFVHLFSVCIPAWSAYIEYLPNTIFQFLVNILFVIIRFFEKLPIAVIEDIDISILDIGLGWLATFSLLFFLIKKNIRLLQTFAFCVFLFIVSSLCSRIVNYNSIIIYNKRENLTLDYHIGYTKYRIKSLDTRKLLYINDQKYLIIVNNEWNKYISSSKLKIDYLHLEGHKSISLHTLNQIFDIKKIILGSTLPKSSVKSLTLECEKLRIPYYDLQKDGTIRINF